MVRMLDGIFLKGVVMSTRLKYIIWSTERQSWYAKNSKGYTFVLGQAGRYSEDQAYKIMSDTDLTGDRHECVIAPECNADLKQELNGLVTTG